MRRWDLPLQLDDDPAQPRFLQIARAISDDIRRGRLRPGDALPGSRTLARSLGVHRNTVLAAYRELEAEGWLATHAPRGTFVSAALPDARPRRFAPAHRAHMPARLGFDLAPPPWPTFAHEDLAPPVPRGTLLLAGGAPDVRLMPAAALARAYRRALKHTPALLGYGDPRGHRRLRVALAALLSGARGVCATEDTLLITRGSQMALDVAARALIRPGDTVAVEGLGYRPAWAALRLAGAEIAPIAVDAAGLDVDALAALCATRRVRAVYVTPHHQYPTTVTLSAGRRLALLALARTRRLAIIEDDYDNEFHYEGRPILPLAAADTDGTVVYIGTLSKILAPGLRLGFLVAPAPLIERATALRLYADRQGDQAVECAVAELLEDGELQRHARRVRRIYQARRDLLADTLARHLGGAITVARPAGGLALWARFADDCDVDALATRALARGAAFYTGRRFRFDGRADPHARLGFAFLDENELREAVRRVAAAWRA